jgi:cation diffusion facilitator family transporter
MDSIERQSKSLKITIIGLLINVVLAILKVTFGIVTLSNALIADGVNNASDSLNSIITLISLKLSNKKPDRKHPFGHQRVEYIFSLIISVIIIFVGVELLKDSVTTIINRNNQLDITLISIIMIGISILLKVAQFIIYRVSSRKLDSMEIKVLSRDSLMDIFITSSILISSLIYYFVQFDLDIYLSTIVGLIIIYSGVSLSIGAINPLIGVVPHRDKIITIIEEIKETKDVLGVHDVIVHSYGYNKTFMTIHVEVDEHASLVDAHNIADQLEETMRSKYNLELLVHVDPIETNNILITQLSEIIKKAIEDIAIGSMDFHEVRIVHPFEVTHKIIFDLVVPPEITLSYSKIIDLLNKEFQKSQPSFKAVINPKGEFI